ncbi:MAG: virulence RhuM family protein [Paludibacteraceae bacterium]|nr:virulence RhuM family protein [Paludibacteraceae bacterium]
MADRNEIILYQPDDAIKLEVRLDDETVWLTQAQMAELFETTRNNVTLHIGNIFKEHELERGSVCKESLQTAADGKKYKTKFYNLDVIISVGYRVKSQRGVQFRQWANRVLKEYLLKGYSINQQLMHLERRIDNRLGAIENKLSDHQKKIDFFVRTSLPPVEGIFFDGQMLEPFAFVNNLIRSAKKCIVLIDNYVDESVLLRLTERADGVSATIYTKQTSPSFRDALERHNAEFAAIKVQQFTKAHDRFLLIDDDVYHIGASVKDLGKRWFAFCKMQLNANDIIHKLVEQKLNNK